MCVSLQCQVDPVQILYDTRRALSRPFGYPRDPKTRLARLDGAMKQLLSRRDDLNNRVRSAELAGQKPTNQFQGWLERVDSVNAKVSQIQTDERSCRWCINRQAEKLLTDIAALHEEAGNSDVVAASLPPSGVQEEPSAGAGVTATQQSMGSYLSQLQAYLRDDGIQIIGIWGMGGVGKTTLLHSLNSELYSSAEGGGPPQFEQVIWAVASKDYKVGKLQHDIAGRLGLPQHEDRHRQAVEIFNFLRNKSFLLLLDDIWQHVDFTEVGIPHPHRPGANSGIVPKQKVVFTTRREDVCGQMKARRKVKLECLKEAEAEAWQLFQENVGVEALRTHPTIPHLARQVAKECDGLPLALVVIGTAMSTKKTPEEWKNAITLLQKSRSYEIHGMEVDKILPRLKFSYDNLPDEIFRKCFLLCSLWPEDYSISKADLIECWMGHGLVDETKFDNINEAYDSGHSLIGCLLAASLLEPGNDTWVKMHDIVRDLALWIASDCGDIPNRYIVRSGRFEDSQREVEKISLVRSELIDTSVLPANCAKLETLMLQYSRYFKSILAGFFEGARALTYIDLSYTAINDLPDEIGRLGKLRYLNLSGTNIEALPEHIGYLRELRFLLLRRMRNGCIFIPEGLLQKLVMLSLIDMTGTRCDKWSEIAKLHGCLKGVSIVLETIEALQQLANVPIWRLELNKLIGFRHPLQLLSPLQLGSRSIRSSIQMLTVRHCASLELVSMDADGGNGLGPNWCLPRLEKVMLHNLPELKKIVWRGVVPSIVLQSLTVLRIIGCHKLSNISWVVWLQSLEELRVYFCDEMEQVVVDESRIEGGRGEEHGEGCEEFPSLRKLYLNNLLNLRTFGGGPFGFPSLEVVHVIRCPKMKSLSFRAKVAGNKLREIRGARDWLDGLEMDGDLRAALLPRFKEENAMLPNQNQSAAGEHRIPPRAEVLAAEGPGMHNYTRRRAAEASDAFHVRHDRYLVRENVGAGESSRVLQGGGHPVGDHRSPAAARQTCRSGVWSSGS